VKRTHTASVWFSFLINWKLNWKAGVQSGFSFTTYFHSPARNRHLVASRSESNEHA